MLNGRVMLSPGLPKVSQEQFCLFRENVPFDHAFQQSDRLVKAVALGQELDKPQVAEGISLIELQTAAQKRFTPPTVSLAVREE